MTKLLANKSFLTGEHLSLQEVTISTGYVPVYKEILKRFLVNEIQTFYFCFYLLCLKDLESSK